MKERPQKNITLLTTQMTGTSNHEARTTEEHHTSYHTDDWNKQPWSKGHRRTSHFLPHTWPQQAIMKQRPQKNITFLTTQMTATSNHEARTTEEHHTSYHTDDCKKQPWSKGHRRTSHFLHFVPHRWLQQATMKQGQQKSITLLTTQMTATSHYEARTTEEHHTFYHTDDHNKGPWSKGHRRESHFLPHRWLQQATMKQGPQKSITLLTTQMTARSNHEVRVTEEHHTSYILYHTDDCNKQPWSKDNRRASHFLPHRWLQQATMKQGPQKSITLLITQMTATSIHEASVKGEHHTCYHPDHCKDHRRASIFLPHRWLQGAQKNITLLTTHTNATSKHEARTTEEHQSPCHTDDCNKQPWR